MLDEEELRLRLDNATLHVSTVTTVEEPSITPLVESLAVELTPEQAARFEDLAEEAYARWEDEAKDLLARRLYGAYRAALGEADTQEAAAG